MPSAMNDHEGMAMPAMGSCAVMPVIRLMSDSKSVGRGEGDGDGDGAMAGST